MRNFNAVLKFLLLNILMLAVIGCGESEEPQLDGTGTPPIPGYVWDPDASGGQGSWVNPDAGYAGGASDDDEDDEEEDDRRGTAGSSANDSDPYAVSEPPKDEDMDEDEEADEPASSSDGYTASGGGYDDPYNQPQADPREYAERVEPILRAHCYNCHGGGPRGMKGDIALHSPNAIHKADVIVANSPDDSELYYRISRESQDRERMPPQGPGLSKDELKVIENWIKAGASFGDAPLDREPVIVAGGGGGGAGGYGAGDGYADDAYATGGRGGRGGGRGGDDEESARQAPSQPENLADWASQSFGAGRDSEAMRQLHAQALVKSDAGKSVLDQYQWVQGLKRAKLAVRWGVGVKYKVKDGFTGSPRAVGVVQDLPGDDFDDVTESEGATADFQSSTLDYYTGDIGKELLLRLQFRIDRSYYGDLLKKELDKARSGGDDDDFDDDDGGFGRGRRRGSGGGGRFGRGRGGRGGGGDAYGLGGGGDNSENEKPDGEKIEQLMPGVTLLGEAPNAELFKRAMEQNVDLLVMFDIVADPNRIQEFVDTSTRVRLYDVLTQEQVAITGKINNIAIQKARSKDGEDETILEEMDKIFEVADEKYRVKEFPDATSAKAQKSVLGFVRGILEHPSEDPLWKLAEVRFYEHRGALKPEHAEAAFKKILPQQAAKLKNVKDDNEIRTTLSKWLVVDDAATGRDDDEESEPDNTFR